MHGPICRFRPWPAHFKEEINGAAFTDLHHVVGRTASLLDWRRAPSDRKCG
jgi:hypothetical protein